MLSCPPVSGGQRPEEARVTQPGRGDRGARGVQDLYIWANILLCARGHGKFYFNEKFQEISITEIKN